MRGSARSDRVKEITMLEHQNYVRQCSFGQSERNSTAGALEL